MLDRRWQFLAREAAPAPLAGPDPAFATALGVRAKIVRLGHATLTGRARDTYVLLDLSGSAMAGRERDRELLLPVVAGEHVAGDEGD